MNDEQSQFIADARKIVERLGSDLEQLRAVRARGPKRRELAARIFRRVHTLKGSAGSLDLQNVSLIAHEFEGVLDGVRLGRIEITDDVLDAFEDASGAIARALADGPSEPGEPGTDAVVERLHALAEKSKKQGTIASGLRSALPAEVARALSEYDLQHAREAIREGAKLFIVAAGFALESFDLQFRELSKLLGQSGEIIATVPGEPANAEEINFRLLYAAELVSNETLRLASALGRIELDELRIEPAAAGEELFPGALPSTAPPTPTVERVTVRVELDELNQLISETSELFRETTDALESLSTPTNKPAVDVAGARLRRRCVELEERLIKLRLVPCAEVFERTVTRAGQTAARQFGKQVEFEIEGRDVGIDKSLADAIAEPLLHLVRNAVGHGIESAEARIAAGKGAIGKVKLAAFNEGSHIHITVTDDGRGIDLDRIVNSATEYGIVNSGEGLSMDQCLRLIFRPGFSTAAEVSELSGRGIGLDIVDRAMEQAGGQVRVATEAGVGTTFVMMLPAALALVDCVLVQSDDQVYGIRSARVADHRSLDPPELANIGRTNTIDWNGEELPVLSLRSLLSQAEDEAEGQRGPDVIVCQADANHRAPSRGQDRFALIVDSVYGKQETLVRGLGRHAARWLGVSGAAELLDGNVALVLDVDHLTEAQSYPDGVKETSQG
ncbi:MAG TPA: ATP-binding protein [Pyrinomonadaceae bacterium]|nr:ATP-binding protein [Pyrinomonadaceae bacterium]